MSDEKRRINICRHDRMKDENPCEEVIDRRANRQPEIKRIMDNGKFQLKLHRC